MPNQKSKISKWWLFKAKIFGKKTIGIGETQYFINKVYAITYKGIHYIYKVKIKAK